jgi:hypothetical protein
MQQIKLLVNSLISKKVLIEVEGTESSIIADGITTFFSISFHFMFTIFFII